MPTVNDCFIPPQVLALVVVAVAATQPSLFVACAVSSGVNNTPTTTLTTTTTTNTPTRHQHRAGHKLLRLVEAAQTEEELSVVVQQDERAFQERLLQGTTASMESSTGPAPAPSVADALLEFILALFCSIFGIFCGQPPSSPAPTIGPTTLPPTISSTITPTRAPITPRPTTRTTLAPTPTPSTSSCQQILWSDEFDSGSSSRPDESVWSYANGMGESGFGNLELQNYARDNVRVRDGKLVITALEDAAVDGSRSFTSGRIRTEDKVEVLYGTLEARIKLPNLQAGLWPAFWTLGGNYGQVGWPACGELDIMEMGSASAIQDGVANRSVASGAHWENEGTLAQFGGIYNSPTELNDGAFHVFRMEWTPTRVTTFVDDNEIWRIDIGPDVCTDCTEFHQPHYILLNLAVGGTFTGILDEVGVTAPFPAELVIDYVRICDNGATSLSGSVFEEPVDYYFDCGSPDLCTKEALNNYAGEFKCGDRIKFLIENLGFPEQEACRQIAGQEFPSQCGVCIAEVMNCGLADSCNDEILSTEAGGFPCRDRIAFRVTRFGETEADACNRVAGAEFPAECGRCTKIDCDMPETCTDIVLDSDTTPNFPCRDRIRFLMDSGLSELNACNRIAGVEFPNECGTCNPFDCNRPDTCTDEVLDTDAGGFSCRDRMTFLINNESRTEVQACNQVASIEFPKECGPCNPIDCNLDQACTREVLNRDAGDSTCGERINFLINTWGFSEIDACNRIGSSEFPDECGPCNPIDCNAAGLCTDSVLEADTGGVTCRDRILFEMSNSDEGKSETEACSQVAATFNDCSRCKPIDCGLAGICTHSVLDNFAGEFTCRSRIIFLINNNNLSEIEACRQIGTDFSDECGVCKPP